MTENSGLLIERPLWLAFCRHCSFVSHQVSGDLQAGQLENELNRHTNWHPHTPRGWTPLFYKKHSSDLVITSQNRPMASACWQQLTTGNVGHIRCQANRRNGIHWNRLWQNDGVSNLLLIAEMQLNSHQLRRMLVELRCEIPFPSTSQGFQFH